MTDIDEEMKNIFCDEALDMITRWESILLELSKAPSADLLQELFRIAHNLKGGSRAIGLNEFGSLVHVIEDAITLLRDGKVPLTVKNISLLFKCQKTLFNWVAAVRMGNSFDEDYSGLVVDVKSISEMDSPNNKSIGETIDPPVVKENNKIDESDKAPLAPVADKIADKITDPGVHTVTKNIDLSEAKNSNSKKNAANNNESIRVQAFKLDELAAMIGELSIHQSILAHLNLDLKIKDKTYVNSLLLGQKLTRQLYDKVLGLRMQPIQSLFQRLERNIYELSQALGKNVVVDLEGSEVELDKMVIEKLVDPLTHIVRNAIDHGIESQEQRDLQGKTGTGKITISAKQETSGIIISVSDDGKGLNTEKIRSKAVEKGLIKENAALVEEQIFQLIFLPGFSTADKVTDVSGRGVGMDVVRKMIEQLKGRVKIESQLGVGSKFHIYLKTSMSLVDGLIVMLAGQLYVIPVDSIEEIIRFGDCDFDSTKSMIYLRNHVIPIEDLSKLLKHHHRHKELSSSEKLNTKILQREESTLLIGKSGDSRLAFLVDKVIGQQQIVVRPLYENISGLNGIMGGSILGNGEPGLIIDLEILISNYVSQYQLKGISA